jgi:hypothetical protein
MPMNSKVVFELERIEVGSEPLMNSRYFFRHMGSDVRFQDHHNRMESLKDRIGRFSIW